jgi:hypothetical protein
MGTGDCRQHARERLRASVEQLDLFTRARVLGDPFGR